jgi:hypothetical protein
MEILHGADKSAGLATDGSAKRRESAASFRGEEDQSLRGFVGDGHPKTFLTNLLVPCLDLGEPALGRWIGGAAQEGNDHDVARGLRFRKVGVDPEAIGGLQIRNFGNGQDRLSAADTHVDGRPGEVEGGTVGQSCGCCPEKKR